jgi:hypothetical protein
MQCAVLLKCCRWLTSPQDQEQHALRLSDLAAVNRSIYKLYLHTPNLDGRGCIGCDSNGVAAVTAVEGGSGRGGGGGGPLRSLQQTVNITWREKREIGQRKKTICERSGLI